MMTLKPWQRVLDGAKSKRKSFSTMEGEYRIDNNEQLETKHGVPFPNTKIIIETPPQVRAGVANEITKK